MKKLLLNVLVLAVVMGLPVKAQNVSLPYQMNFEENEAAELSQWELNPGANASALLDQWVVGKSVHSAGRQALYISNNNRDAQFDSVPGVQYAYREFLLPAGQYDLTFDWLCVGASGSSLFVGCTDFSGVALQARVNNGNILAAVKARMLPSLSDLKGVDTWQAASIQIQSDGVTPNTLVFAWANKNTKKEDCNIGACVDNIVITNANCKRPTNIIGNVISCDSVQVTWTGISGSYEFAYRAVGEENWITRHNVIPVGTQGSVYLANMSEGSYDFRVRGICPPDTSAWAYLSGFVVFCPETHCVNFTDLHAPSVTCTYGETDYEYSSSHSSANYDNPNNRNHAYDNIGVVDFGSDAIQSRHTVNWDKAATDPRTDDNLPLVPAGAYASVRLGNWEYGNGAESVTYDYVVDSSSAVLLMQYAVVLEYPSGHSDDAMPRFVLEVLDKDGNILDNICGVRNFFAKEADGVAWKSASNGGVVYKPWTTVGLNLMELGVQDGDHIKVRLTTYDCFLSGHYGYAYFTLDCARAVIETASCAKDASMVMSLVAPDGFRYQWYNSEGNAIPGATTRTFFPTDTATYKCVLTSTEEASCRFELVSQCFPRLPMPEFKPEFATGDCRNNIQMVNTSFIREYKHEGIVDNHDEKCDYYYWETWGTATDGSNFQLMSSDHESPIFEYPQQGGDFFVKLTARISNTCEEDTVMPVHLDPIQSYSFERDTVLCRPMNDPTFALYLDGERVTESGKYTINYKTRAGCDSIITWDVTINESYQIQLSDTAICYGESICYGDSCIGPKSGSLYRTGMWIWDHIKTAAGCDSVIMRRVTLHDPIKPVFTVKGETLEQPYALVYLEDGETAVDITVGGTGFETYAVAYMDAGGSHKTDVHTPSDNLLKDLSVNEYIFTFTNEFGCELVDTVLVGGDTLCVDLLSQIQCACGKSVLDIPFRKCQPANKARLSSCAVKFADADKAAQGFADALFTGLSAEDTIHIDVPAGAEPGEYKIDLIFDTVIGGCIWGQNAFHTAIKLTYDSSVIFHRWTNNAIISLAGANVAKKADGSDYALYAFSDFQWLRNGEEVEGETLSYMEQPGVLNMSDRYALRMTRSDGQIFTTCAYVPGNNTRYSTGGAAPKASVAPSDPVAGAPVELTVTEDAEVEIYTLMGNKVFAGEFKQGVSSFRAPTAQGIYIMTVRMRGEAQTLRFRVR